MMATATTKPKTPKIDRRLAKKLLGLIDLGLRPGLGDGTPGNMCIEACVCHVLNQPNGDNPTCVDGAARAFKISLNDSLGWSDGQARAAGMRRAGIAQLGSKGVINPSRFAELLVEKTVRVIVPIALRLAASAHRVVAHKSALSIAADDCEQEGTRAVARATHAAYAADAAVDAVHAATNAVFHAASMDRATQAADYAADAAEAAVDAARATHRKDYILSVSAELCVQALIECGSPGAKWLDLAPLNLPPCPKGIKPFEVK